MAPYYELIIKKQKRHQPEILVFSWTKEPNKVVFDDGTNFIEFGIIKTIQPSYLLSKPLLILNDFINFIPKQNPTENYLSPSPTLYKRMVAFLIEIQCNFHINGIRVEIFGSSQYNLFTVYLSILLIESFYKFLISEGKFGDANPITPFHPENGIDLTSPRILCRRDYSITDYYTKKSLAGIKGD